jgi:hypothetical protein
MTLVQKFFNLEAMTDILPIIPWFTGYIYWKRHEAPFFWMTIFWLLCAVGVQFVWNRQSEARRHAAEEKQFRIDVRILQRKLDRNKIQLEILEPQPSSEEDLVHLDRVIQASP